MISDGHHRRLRKRLDEQIDFLQSSGERFDAGAWQEANRLAVTVRVLVHDTNQSTSLLSHLAVKNRQTWMFSRLPGPTHVALWHLSQVKVATRVNEEGPYLVVAPLTRNEILEFPVWTDNFEYWWTIPIMVAGEERLSRKDIVLLLSNQDGGAHIDLTKNRYIKLLQSVPLPIPLHDENGVGIAFGAPHTFEVDGDDETEEDLPLRILRAAMRTISEEVLLTLEEYLRENPLN
ncbi:MAG: hypothetical protein ACTIJ6_09935 [Leucobacter sp.]